MLCLSVVLIASLNLQSISNSDLKPPVARRRSSALKRRAAWLGRGDMFEEGGWIPRVPKEDQETCPETFI
jgi:hypothetical protein